MKKMFLSMAAVAIMLPVSAQTTYNFFDPADCDAEGWLWLDSSAKLNKYCGYNTKSKSYKVQLCDANYELPDFTYPEVQKSATVKGFNAEGVKGGEGSKTGGLILPKSEATNPHLGDSQYGGGIALNLPDIAELSLYISLDYKEMFAVYAGVNKDTRWQDAPVIRLYYEHNLASLHSPVPGISYCGTWENIQDVTGYNPETDADDRFIQHEPGVPATIYIANLVEGHEAIIHGIKLLTYTNTNSDSAVNEIAADNDADAKTFNLFGVEVDESYKGVVIRNGKKLIQR